MTEDDWVEYSVSRPTRNKTDADRIKNCDKDILAAYELLTPLVSSIEEMRQSLYFKLVTGNDIASKFIKYKIDEMLATLHLTDKECYRRHLKRMIDDLDSSDDFHPETQQNGILCMADLLEKIK
jgi:hypothetical protein